MSNYTIPKRSFLQKLPIPHFDEFPKFMILCISVSRGSNVNFFSFIHFLKVFYDVS
jgi:hypothetical protein